MSWFVRPHEAAVTAGDNQSALRIFISTEMYLLSLIYLSILIW